MTSDDAARWPLRILRLEDDVRDDLSGITTPEQRIEMVWDLSARMWELTGRPFPSYARHDMPGLIIRAR